MGTLTVDLVANTATFTADLGAAGNSLEGFGQKGEAAGKSMDFSMREARGSMMMLGEEVGVHIPRHLQYLIATIPGVGAAFAEMLPIVGVVMAIAIIEKLIAKTAEAKEKMAQGWDNFGVTVQNVFNGLDDKLLQVGKSADELAGRHLAALHKELLLIDHASLRELSAEFGKLTAAADKVFTDMKSHWYEIRMGSEGAQNALTHFRGEYDLLLAKGDKKGAFDKLVGTLDSANQELSKMVAQENTIYAPSQKLVESQRLLVSILEDQLRVTKEVEAAQSGEKSNVTTKEDQRETKSTEEFFKKVAEARHKALEIVAHENDEEVKSWEEMNKRMEADSERSMKEEAKTAEEAIKLNRELNAEELKNSLAMAKLQESAEDESIKHRLAMRQISAKEATALEVKAAQERMMIDLNALNYELEALDKSDAKYLVKLQEFENKKKQVIQQGENDITKIRQQAEQKQYQDFNKAEQQMADAVVKTVTTSLREHKSMAKGFEEMGAQMAEAAAENAMKMLLTNNMTKGSDAAAAARHTYNTISAIPIVGPFLAPPAAAAAFAAVMAFEGGGEVPGIGNEDNVHAMVMPGETIVSKQLTDQVKNSRSGGGGHTFHFSPTIHAVDAEGVDRMLAKHESVFVARMTAALRKNHVR